MYRTHTCGSLRVENVNERVTLAGWVQKVRNLGAMTFIDLRDRYGITQIVVEEHSPAQAREAASRLGREFVVQVTGRVVERSSKNPKMPTGDIEVAAEQVNILNEALTPPFTIEEVSDGGDDLRMKYRYLDLRRPPLQRNLILRHKMAQEIRRFLDAEGFLEIETPYLVGSTPEGARDFVVPSRMNPNQFYALPQSPQTLKQLLMVAGYDKYFQIVRCFRDEDLRADRQPEFTQIDCEMSFVEQEDILEVFERWAKHMFHAVMGIDFTEPFRRMPWIEAMEKYGSDKPDLRFGMEFSDLTELAKGHGFSVFDNAEYVTGFAATGCATYTRKQIDALTEYVKRPQVGAKGLIWLRVEESGIKSSIDKFFTPEQVRALAERCGAKAGDMVFILSGPKFKTLTQLCALRLEVAQQLGLRDPKKFAPLWVVDFPMFEWDEETQRFYAMHHPFTSPKPEDYEYLESDPGRVRANAYDFVCNGTEIGGGSIRIHDAKLQARIFKCLGFTPERAQEQFGFLMNAFKYGAPPHGGLAFGFDRLCSLFGGSDSIRDYIAFPKNNAGRDVMLDAPSYLDQSQLDELYLELRKPEK
ncbi:MULTISPECIES: aspartate--tRNA ligase [unclassified Alistipes]|jgi:aspartyl-tRNA synthetase|uniref:aspartate--tRNA ligase n=1 Tax=unclassified Alistipes TaxID=2608932 RepID=UPI000B38AEBD|nr:MULTISPECIES: aspartate--tRNA ligase [unclassified Alistipes]OUO22167.1 aspartate--tRNA ligase [Alistipes sp. An31A]HIV33474.1 aspartate--tRNA ligase [Candidatus Alistipes excrementigallinarum]